MAVGPGRVVLAAIEALPLVGLVAEGVAVLVDAVLHPVAGAGLLGVVDVAVAVVVHSASSRTAVGTQADDVVVAVIVHRLRLAQTPARQVRLRGGEVLEHAAPVGVAVAPPGAGHVRRSAVVDDAAGGGPGPASHAVAADDRALGAHVVGAVPVPV